MKKYMFFILILGVLIACSTSKNVTNKSKAEVEISSDSTEYELVVMDARFETYLASQSYPKDFYSNDYYKQWNIRYCTEWNIRHSNPLRYGDFYVTDIPYDASVEYGLDFNYRLYHYFLFIEKKYGIVLVSRRGQVKNR
nr:DUF6146 family protein [uncultured Carboxylicivirga sp.]